MRVGAYYSIPRAALHLHGVIHVKVLRTWEMQAKNIIFILLFVNDCLICITSISNTLLR
ncbi:MAG: hypothetical protein LBL39_02705 [Planctomycetaceae bacterium]|nr:hypothetical protein [Planctomycetaceae bacterium]